MARHINLDEAIKLFYELADRDDIPFHAAQACQARCSHMTSALKERDIEVKLICAFGKPGKSLWVDWHIGMHEVGGWTYHVAPTISVIEENGEIKDMVFDPSLFDGPVSVRDWANEMKAEKNGIVKVAQDKGAQAKVSGFYEYEIGNVSERCIRSQYEKWAPPRGRLRRMVRLSPVCNRYFKQKRDINRPKFGKTWTTDQRFRMTKNKRIKHFGTDYL